MQKGRHFTLLFDMYRTLRCLRHVRPASFSTWLYEIHSCCSVPATGSSDVMFLMLFLPSDKISSLSAKKNRKEEEKEKKEEEEEEKKQRRNF